MRNCRHLLKRARTHAMDVDETTPQPQTSSAEDDLYVYDDARARAIAEDKPWTRNPHYFKRFVTRILTRRESTRYDTIRVARRCE